MSAWSDSRIQMFALQVSMWGTPLTHNGISYACTTTPLEDTKDLQRTNLMPTRPGEFSMWRFDYVLSHIRNGNPRSMVTVNGANYEVFAIVNDPAEPFVQLRCNLHV